jgi:large-conductance mechanosensitive channel
MYFAIVMFALEFSGRQVVQTKSKLARKAPHTQCAVLHVIVKYCICALYIFICIVQVNQPCEKVRKKEVLNNCD